MRKFRCTDYPRMPLPIGLSTDFSRWYNQVNFVSLSKLKTMAHVEIYVHVVWATKKRAKILTKQTREILFKHIEDYAKEKSICIDCINGYLDHIHCLIRLAADQSIAKTMQTIKGEASFWANKNALFQQKLDWAEDYYAASVGKSNLGNIRAYIYAQEIHHRDNTFESQYEI